jgi:hypothetical protein
MPKYDVAAYIGSITIRDRVTAANEGAARDKLARIVGISRDAVAVIKKDGKRR